MDTITALIKPASSMCNMRCKYCFYSDISQRRKISSYGIMDNETARAVLEKLFAAVNPRGVVNIAFQGGEPTLSGLYFFKNFSDVAREISKAENKRISYSIQTNGQKLDEEWCRYLKKENFLVGLSLDGTKGFHDINRVDDLDKGTWATTMQAAELLEKNQVDFNILCVLNKQNSGHPEKLWNFFYKHKMHYLQFIPCLPEMDKEKNPYSLTPKLFHDFYLVLFGLWKDELSKGHYVSIELFDDMINMLLYGKITGCGMDGRCNLQYVIEADGSVYPCDFYVLDEYCLGNLKINSISEIENYYHKSSFIDLRKELPSECEKCKYVKLCYGGCLRLRQSMYLSGDYCGYRELLKDIGNDLLETAGLYFA